MKHLLEQMQYICNELIDENEINIRKIIMRNILQLHVYIKQFLFYMKIICKLINKFIINAFIN